MPNPSQTESQPLCGVAGEKLVRSRRSIEAKIRSAWWRSGAPTLARALIAVVMEQAMMSPLQQVAASNAAVIRASEKQGHILREFSMHGASREGVVDIRQVGKPDPLKGSTGSILGVWPFWSYTFGTLLSSLLTTGGALGWARDSECWPRSFGRSPPRPGGRTCLASLHRCRLPSWQCAGAKP